MRKSVMDSFIEFSARFEGRINCMYLDTHQPPLCTTGIGNLIDPVELALALPWKWKTTTWLPKGSLASQEEIRGEWNRVKMSTTRATGKTAYWISSANLYLENEDVNALVLKKLNANDEVLKMRFPGFGGWPADAQLAAHSMAWAMGPMFFFPHFETACALHDFATASVECHMDDTHNAGLMPRNAANKILFANASLVTSRGLDYETLYYPKALTPVTAGMEGVK